MTLIYFIFLTFTLMFRPAVALSQSVITGPNKAIVQDLASLERKGQSELGLFNITVPYDTDLNWFSTTTFTSLHVCLEVNMSDIITLSTTTFKVLETNLNKLNNSNCKVSVLISFSSFPEHLKKTYPETNLCGTESIPFCISHPGLRKLTVPALLELVTFLRNKKVAYFQLNRNLNCAEFCDLTVTSFRERVKQVYKSIDTLNRKWGTAYINFDRINITLELLNNPQTSSGLRYEWYRFHSAIVTDYFLELKKIIQEIQLHTPVYFPVVNFFQAGKSMVDNETIAEFNEKIVTNISLTPLILSGTSNGESIPWFSEHFMWYDYLSTLNKPVSITYTLPHTYLPEFVRYIPNLFTEQVVRQIAIQSIGVDISMDKNIYSSIIPTLATMQNKIQTLQDGPNRFSEFVKSVSQSCGDVGILFSPVAYILNPTHYPMVKETYTNLMFLDYPIQLVTDQQIAKDLLPVLKLLFIPQTVSLTQNVYLKIIDFVSRGGYLVVIGKSMLKNEYGEVRQQDKFITVLNSLFSANEGTQVYGKGKIFYFNRLPQSDKFIPWVEEMLTKISITRPVRITSSDTKINPGVCFRYLTSLSKNRKYIYLNNLRTTSVAIELTADKPFHVSPDIFTGKDIYRTLTLETVDDAGQDTGTVMSARTLILDAVTSYVVELKEK